MEEKKEENTDWRELLNKLNSQIKQVEELPREPQKTEDVRKEVPSKDFVDIKLEYRRIKIQEQCKKLNSRVVLPSRSSWRDRMAGTATDTDKAAPSQSLSSSCKITSPENVRRTNLNWGQRRTKVYHVDSEIDVHKFKIIDTIHIKRSQIEARLAEYNEETKRKKEDQSPGELLMLTFPGYDKLHVEKQSEDTINPTEESEDPGDTFSPETQLEEPEDISIDPNLDGLVLKDNTKKKLSQFTQHLTDAEKAKKIKSPPLPKRKNYTTSVDWREELKNRDRARQLQELKGFKIGTPDYKEPEKEKEEAPVQKVEDKWGKTLNNKWEKFKLKPTLKSQEKIKEKEEVRSDEPFKINLKPVTERKKGKEGGETDSPGRLSNSKRRTGQLHSKSSAVDSRDAREFEKLSQSPTVNQKCRVKNNLLKQEEEVKPTKIRDLSRKTSLKRDDKKKPGDKNNNDKNLTSKNKDLNQETHDKKYVIKVINFVAIKVALDKTPTERRRNPEKKKSNDRPPIPTEKPPSLPLEEEISVAQECQLEEINHEIVNILNTDFDERLNNEILDELMIEIIKDNPEFKTAKCRREIVQTCPKPRSKSVYKMKEEKSYDEKYFKPRRRKILDYVPETLPVLRRRDDLKVQPMKFSSVSDNCVTKSLFVGSQYIGHK